MVYATYKHTLFVKISNVKKTIEHSLFRPNLIFFTIIERIEQYRSNLKIEQKAHFRHTYTKIERKLSRLFLS